MWACVVDRLSAAGGSRRGVSVRCSLNGRFLNGYSYVIILFWKKQSPKIVKMLNKRTNVRVCAVPILRR